MSRGPRADETEAAPSGTDGCSPERLEALVEALLFVAEGPASIQDVARALGAEREAVQRAVDSLTTAMAQRGLRLQKLDGQVQLVTAPEISPYVERFLGLRASARLSPAALETLAIAAYRQPVTRAQVEAIRGVSSDAVMRGLVAKGLLEPVGRLEQAGRPILYGTTAEFLQHFGLSRLNALPPMADDVSG